MSAIFSNWVLILKSKENLIVLVHLLNLSSKILIMMPLNMINEVKFQRNNSKLTSIAEIEQTLANCSFKLNDTLIDTVNEFG